MDDEAIRARIRAGFERYGQIWCPHTATAAEVYARLPRGAPRPGRWVIVSTAHPAKFREIVEPLIGREVPVPETLAKLFARPTQCTEIEPSWPRCGPRCETTGIGGSLRGGVGEASADRVGADRGCRRSGLRRLRGCGAGIASTRTQVAARGRDGGRIGSPRRHARAGWHGRRLSRRLPAADHARRSSSSTCAMCRATSSAAIRWRSGR